MNEKNVDAPMAHCFLEFVSHTDMISLLKLAILGATLSNFLFANGGLYVCALFNAPFVCPGRVLIPPESIQIDPINVSTDWRL